MIVSAEGVITSKELKVKPDKDGKSKKSTELLLAQPGEKVQAVVRLPGDQIDAYEVFERAAFTGQLMAWSTRDGVGMMIMVRDDDGN